jgi:acyl dehydratase
MNTTDGATGLITPLRTEVTTHDVLADLYFEDADIGTIRTAGPYLVTNEIIQFAKQYNPVPRHLDEEAAARSIFGGLTASGAHTFAVFISLTPKLRPPLRVLAGMDGTS